MIYKYEIACREAGLSEEQTAEIRKVFDNDKKRLKRENQRMVEEEILCFSMDRVQTEDDVEAFEIEDLNANTEEQAIKKLGVIKT